MPYDYIKFMQNPKRLTFSSFLKYLCYNSFMKVHELSYYSQFQCTMGNCPNTCCHGWQIELDQATVQKYMTMSKLDGLLLRSRLKRRNGTVMFKNSNGSCPFLTKELLCKIQLSLGEDYMADVCRIFPRHRINYGLFAEELLFLACPQACRLFLNHLDHLYFQTAEREVNYAKTGTNEDTDYLQELLGIRHALTARIMDSNLPLPMLYTGLLSYAKKLQQFYITNYKAKRKPCSLPDPADSLSSPAAPLIIPHDTTYAMLTSGFYHIFLKFVSPFLYDLCQMYFKQFRRLIPTNGDAMLKELKDFLHSSNPNADRILRAYLVYYLLENFFATYEDYSFYKNISIGIMHTHLLELFLALYYKKNLSLTEDEIIQIITVCTRRGQHNDTIEAAMYEKLKSFLNT